MLSLKVMLSFFSLFSGINWWEKNRGSLLYFSTKRMPPLCRVPVILKKSLKKHDITLLFCYERTLNSNTTPLRNPSYI